MISAASEHSHHSSHLIEQFDPRTRVLAALLMILAVSTVRSYAVLVPLLGFSVFGAGYSRLGVKTIARRLIPFNLFIFLAFLLVPWQSGGESLFSVGSLTYELQGGLLVLRTAILGNTVLLTLITFLGNMETVTLGHALGQLGMSRKLVQMFLFMVRYLGLIEEEWLRMTLAAKVRGFRPKMNLHTYKTYSQMIGMLFVRSLERSERVYAAMICRGFRGQFHTLTVTQMRRYDYLFLGVVFFTGTILAIFG